MASINRVPVFIVGGGPVGLALALALDRFGIGSLVVERSATTTEVFLWVSGGGRPATRPRSRSDAAWGAGVRSWSDPMATWRGAWPGARPIRRRSSRTP